MECLFSTGLLLKTLGLFDNDTLTRDFAVLILTSCLKAEDLNVYAFTGYLLTMLTNDSECK